MAKPLLAGRVTHKLAFERRPEVNPDHPHDEGNTVSGSWVENFRTAAELVILRGGEKVMTGRLQGTQSVILRVRNTSKTRTLKTDWRARDLQSGAVYNIRDITPDPVSRASIDILCESGVAS